MARVLHMPEPKKLHYCPLCGTTKIHALKRLMLVSIHDRDIVSDRYLCKNGHVFIRTKERRAAAAAASGA